ncbi:uncharacterized protein [Antedon mediterranea]|uniref:uncharacterized protein isoform X2 n=1 Tax=Antedon mediterranea TaxID=105859 RepID=UPI003AF61551
MAEANTLSDQSPTKSTVAGVVKREGKKGRLRTTSKVRFPEDVHEPDILVSRENNGAIDINVGFLLSQHKYEASFTIEDSIKDDIEVPTDQQILLRVRNIYTSQNGSEAVFEGWKKSCQKDPLELASTSAAKYSTCCCERVLSSFTTWKNAKHISFLFASASLLSFVKYFTQFL